MRRYLGIGAAWLGATALSVAIASAAVAGIRDRVVETPGAIGVPTTTTQPADAAPGTSGPVATFIGEATTSTTTAATTTTDAPAVTTTTVPSAATTSTSGPPATTTTTTTAPPATTTTAALTYVTRDLTGGTVVLAVGDGNVNLVSAVPRPGFTTDIEHAGPKEVEIKFESNDHKSKLEAKWEDGKLKVDTEEESRGEDSADD